MGQIEEVTQQNAALVEEASAAANAVAEQAAGALKRARRKGSVFAEQIGLL